MPNYLQQYLDKVQKFWNQYWYRHSLMILWYQNQHYSKYQLSDAWFIEYLKISYDTCEAWKP